MVDKGGGKECWIRRREEDVIKMHFKIGQDGALFRVIVMVH